MKLFSKEDAADRSAWKSGPWDSEPDYYEWTTRAGYPAYIGRLDSGAWAGAVTAPEAPGEKSYEKMKFHRRLQHMSHTREFNTGMSSYTDVDGIIEYCSSGEHWEAPGPSNRTFWRGPYKTMEEFKERLENLADAILELHNNPDLYKDF